MRCHSFFMVAALQFCTARSQDAMKETSVDAVAAAEQNVQGPVSNGCRYVRYQHGFKCEGSCLIGGHPYGCGYRGCACHSHDLGTNETSVAESEQNGRSSTVMTGQLLQISSQDAMKETSADAVAAAEQNIQAPVSNGCRYVRYQHGVTKCEGSCLIGGHPYGCGYRGCGCHSHDLDTNETSVAESEQNGRSSTVITGQLLQISSQDAMKETSADAVAAAEQNVQGPVSNGCTYVRYQHGVTKCEGSCFIGGHPYGCGYHGCGCHSHDLDTNETSVAESEEHVKSSWVRTGQLLQRSSQDAMKETSVDAVAAAEHNVQASGSHGTLLI